MGDNYFSMLFPHPCNKLEHMQPPFFEDLQLTGICKAIVTKYMDFDVLKYYYTMPGSPNTIRYRQDIYRDLENNEFLIVELKKYTNQLLSCETCYRLYQQMDDSIKKGSYLLLTCKHYVAALELLRDALDKAELLSAGFTGLKERICTQFDDPDFISFYHTIQDAFSYMKQLQLVLLVRDKEISVLEEAADADSSDNVTEQLRQYMRQFGVPVEEKWNGLPDMVMNPFPAPLETSPLEDTIVEVLKKSRAKVFEVLKQFAAFEFSLQDNIYLQIKNEIAFYISFLEFEKQLSDAGYELYFPEIVEDERLELTDVYDIVLAWKSRFSGYPVVYNDVSYRKGKSFLVITGPNQGGKTTLARAVGQSLYFMLLGLKAPCRSMKSRFFQRILTHFEVEESVETGAGKLKEELQRLKPMMHIYAENSFVILNELFTTATTYDAKIMAQKVMEHFISHNCLGIYVTHIQELADEEVQKEVQSMVAQIDEKDPSIRTFKIVPMAANGLGYSDSIVKKYELDFEQVTERIASI